MTFSQRVKEELAEHIDPARHCRLAELAAIMGSCGQYSVRTQGRMAFSFQTENLYVAETASALLKKAFQVRPEVSVVTSTWTHSRVYILVINGDEDTKRILMAEKLLQENGVLRDLSMPVNSLITRSSCCKRAYLRGAFLCSGSVTDPKRSYHFEIVCENEERMQELVALIATFGIEAKMIRREKNCAVYIKDSDQIIDMLNIMGATRSLMEMENIRILHDISGTVNRQVNCETANMKKTVSAAVAQVRNIELIRDRRGLSTLPPELEELAEIRLENPDTPLAELGGLLTPPLGKSGIYHRFQRIARIADDIRRNE